MTAQELFNLSVGVMGQTPSQAQSYLETYIPILNTVLQQTLKLENNNREFKSLTILDTQQVVTALSDVLTYQDNVLRNVAVWGIAQIFALNDEDTIKAGFYETRYADGMQLENKGNPTEVKDWFSTESDE